MTFKIILGGLWIFVHQVISHLEVSRGHREQVWISVNWNRIECNRVGRMLHLLLVKQSLSHFRPVDCLAAHLRLIHSFSIPCCFMADQSWRDDHGWDGSRGYIEQLVRHGCVTSILNLVVFCTLRSSWKSFKLGGFIAILKIRLIQKLNALVVGV